MMSHLGPDTRSDNKIRENRRVEGDFRKEGRLVIPALGIATRLVSVCVLGGIASGMRGSMVGAIKKQNIIYIGETRSQDSVSVCL